MAQEPDLVISAGFSDAMLVREANKVVAAFKKRGEDAQKAFQDARGKVTDTQAARAHARNLDRLSKAYDPVYRAAEKYRVEVRRLDQALDVGAVSQTKYTAEVARAAREMREASAAVDTTAKAGSRMTGTLQSAGYQVGDFAVQVGAGTSAVQALGQQLPQFLGSFGAFGAVAGAAAAIAIPLGAALYKVATDTKSLEEYTNDLTKSTDAYVEAAKSAVTPISDLRAQYGDLADDVARANSAMSMLTAIRAKSDLLGATQSLSGALGVDLSPDPLPRRGDGSIDPNREYMQRKSLERDMARIQNLTGASAQQVDRLRMALNRVDSSNSVQAVAKDAEALLAIIAELVSNDGADQDFLIGWASQVDAVMRQAQRQMEAGADATLLAQQRVIDAYQTDTDTLKSLADDRAVAQGLLDDALKSGSDAAIRQAEERLRLIDREINSTKALARETDAAFQSMLSAYTEYADSRRAGNEWANSAPGFEAQYVAARASGAGSAEEELVRAVTALAQQMDISAKDLLAVMSFETGGKLRPDVMGPTTKNGQHFGLIQFGDKGAGPRYGVTPNSSITEQVIAAGKYLEDAGVKAGDSLANVYAAVLSGNARNVNASDLAAGGVVGNVTAATSGDQFAPHIARAEGLLAAYGSVAREAKDDATEADRALKDQIRERERLAKQAADYGAQLAANLITQQQSADLDAAAAAQVAAIKGLRMSPEAEARAIAQVTAEIERQRTVMALHADAKRRNVDLDAQLADGSMTYRQAIEALGAAKAADILASNGRAEAEGRAADAMAFMATQQQSVEQGLIRSIAAGESFTQVLANVAQAFAQAALQAALFGSGPKASGGAGLGILGKITQGIFGGGDPLSAGLRGAGLSPVRSFDGGGYTWDGPRSGGLDGKGGQLHLLHPNERVLDLSRGQGAGASSRSVALTVDLRGTTGDRELDAKLRRSAAAILQQVPSVMADHQKRDG